MTSPPDPPSITIAAGGLSGTVHPRPRPLVEFFVPGVPRSTQTGSVMRFGKRLMPIRRGTAWSSMVGLAARQHRPTRPFTGPCGLTLVFHLPRPESSERDFPSVRPDLDNLVKGLPDTFNGVLWVDDAQVIEMTVSKLYSQTPGVLVVVEQLVEPLEPQHGA